MHQNDKVNVKPKYPSVRTIWSILRLNLCLLDPLWTTWVHNVHMDPTQSTWVHLGPLESTWIHFCQLWSTWVHWDHLGWFGSTLVHFCPILFIWVQFVFLCREIWCFNWVLLVKLIRLKQSYIFILYIIIRKRKGLHIHLELNKLYTN